MDTLTLPMNTLLQGGKYRIVHFISSGGFGCTYEAEHILLEKRVAIKEFFVKDFCNRDGITAHVSVGTTSKKALVDKLRRKFIDEARALSHLEHKGIVKVSDVFEENGTAYYVMDYIEGKSLGKMLRDSGALSEQSALGYIRQVADALKYVHSNNRLHLDIKPDNIMVDGNGNAILIDFGASKQYDEESGENTSTLMGRTPGYAPLEQMGNDVVKFMPATDIYALGATLYKLLTGVTPLSATLIASGYELTPLPNTVSEKVRDAVTAAMQTNKNKRPQSIDEFLIILNSGAASKNLDENEETVIDNKEKVNKEISILDNTNKVEEGSKEKLNKEDEKSREDNQAVVVLAALIVGLGLLLFIVAYCHDHPDRTFNDNYAIEEDTVVGEDIVAGVDTLPFSENEEYNKNIEHEIDSVKPTGKINGHEYADLGLSVKWATCNVGASSPSDYGNYYAWGETTPKGTYTEENSKTYGKNMGSIAGNSQYDAARANWGGSWRLPTASEIDELKSKCKYVWTTKGGVNGYKVTGPNGNSIFSLLRAIVLAHCISTRGVSGSIRVPQLTRVISCVRTSSTSLVAISTGIGPAATTVKVSVLSQNSSTFYIIKEY